MSVRIFLDEINVHNRELAHGALVMEAVVAVACLVVSDSATPWTAACHASLSVTISQSLPKFMFITSVIPSSHLIVWCPLLLLPSIFPSIKDFSNESSASIRWPKYWSFSISISPSSEYSVLISLKTDSFDLLAVQGTFRLVQVNDTFAFYKRELSKKDWFLVSWVTVSFWGLLHCRDQKYASRMKKLVKKS